MFLRLFCLFTLCSTRFVACSVRKNTNISRDCTLTKSEAPFGLSEQLYEYIYRETQAVYSSLVVHGCSHMVLGSLNSCDITLEREIRELISGTSLDCQAQLAKEIESASAQLFSHGCLEDEESRLSLDPSVKLYKILSTASTLSSRTTCSAFMRTSRHAFTLALERTPTDLKHMVPGISSNDTMSLLDRPIELPRKETIRTGPSLWTALLAGALAGLAVDLSLYPLDTIKTRLQSSEGFSASGGFANLYQGIGSIALGSAPSSALFFLAYEFAGRKLTQNIGQTFFGHLLATTIGEVASSLIRVPADVVKSRLQVEIVDGSARSTSLWVAIQKVSEESSRPNSKWRLSAFYTGWLSSLLREIPFGCIQFPVFEYLKELASTDPHDTTRLSIFVVALCGMVAGALAGGITTPLDVVKTRIMLSQGGRSGIVHVLKCIVREEGPRGFFKGIVPRTIWISFGGAIFLGGYSVFVSILDV